MAAKALFLLGLLTVHVSCRQNSLTFVIDDTGSMYNDIRQVKSATKSIMDIVLKEKTSQIEDIVLVTFNDPGTRLRKKTRDANELRHALDEINVGGGGDCEEMSLSGIKKGLEESRPGSYVYVFTDASAKDYNKFAEVKTLCQEKQSQIVFVLTGHCDDRDKEAYKVYRKLATASSGQVFDISKDEVGQVLEYVKETIKGDRTVIGTATIPAKQWRDIKFNIDDQTEYAIVSASGRNVKLGVVNQNTDKVAGVRITWTSNVKVMKLTNLTPGTYTARVWGNSEVNIMVFGRTDFNFQHGFSTEVKNSLAGTDPQPTTGVQTHLLVSVQDKTHSANIRQVELRDMDDRVVKTLPLTLLTGDLYITEKFLSPQQTFKIAVVATSHKSGNTIRRVAKTPVTPIQSVAPEIHKGDKIIKLKEGGSVDLRCSINKGKPMPQITWYVKKQGAAGFTQLTGTDDVIHVTNALTNDQYKCMAKNVAGNDEHTVQLDVQVAPKFPDKHDVLTKKEGEAATIDCKLHKGNPPPKISWQFKPRDASYKPMSYEGNVLSIKASQFSHSGHYRCVANNAAGWDEKITELVVQVAPEIYKGDKIIKVKEGGSVDLRCRIYKGTPMPHITWYMKKQGAAGFTQLTGSDDVIHVTNALTNDQYKCMAKNVAGNDKHTLQLDVQVAPKFPNKHDVLTKKEGEAATIDCKLHKGNPPPKISWQFKPRDASYKPMSYEGNVLSIKASQFSHSGHYRCVANNAAGWDEKITELVVQVAPEIYKGDKIIKVKEGGSVDLRCRIYKGTPMPHITWYMKKQGAAGFTQLTGSDDVIHVTNALTNDQYKCMAKNVAGNDKHTLQLDVQVAPKFPNKHDVLTKKEGEPATIDCQLPKGNPPPKISWQFKPRDGSYKPMRHEGNVLSIVATQLSHAGHYRCVANNAEGGDEKITELVIKAKPAVEKLPPVQSVMENKSVNLHCRVTTGFPKPTVNWFYKGPGSTKYESKNTDHIRIGNVQLTQAGLYMCVAENEMGRHEQVVQLVVNAPPRIVTSTNEYIAVEGDVAIQVPCTAAGFPVPTITWKVDDQVIGTDKSKRLHVEGNALLLLHPKSADSTNKTHSYVCHAANKFGSAVQNFTVFVDEYIDLKEPNGTKYGLRDQPFDVICPLPFKDPSSVRWYKDYEDLNKTGDKLHFASANITYSGNYTCRVSDMTGKPISQTIQVIFGQPPKSAITSFDIEWPTQEEKYLSPNLDTNPIPYGKYEWFYNGQKLENARSDSLAPIGWGEYTCRVSNPFGNVLLTWKVTTHNKECGIKKSLLKKNNAPVTLDFSLSWPEFSSIGQYIIVPHSEKLQLFCPSVNNVKTASTNGFTKFPALKSIYATCDHEDYFLVDGVPRKISELDCKHRVTPSVMPTRKLCLGQDTELMRVGFHVNGFTGVYQSCIDKIKNVPLYTKMNTIPIEDRSISSRSSPSMVKTAKQLCLDKCCYENIQLVSAEDVSFGPAEKATTFMNSLNYVNYCKPINGTNWHDIEKMGREPAQLTVWSGATQYTKIGEVWTPKYLWKVLKETDRSEKVVVIHENVNTPSPKLCSGKCGVEFDWFEPWGDRTYCCSLADFKTVFGVNIDFDEY